MSEDINDLSKRVDRLTKKTGETFIGEKEVIDTLREAVCNLNDRNSFLLHSVELYSELFQKIAITLREKDIFTDKDAVEILEPLMKNMLKCQELAKKLTKE
jgi:hypothetical protein